MIEKRLWELEEQRAGVAWVPERLHQLQGRLDAMGQEQRGIGGKHEVEQLRNELHQRSGTLAANQIGAVVEMVKLQEDVQALSIEGRQKRSEIEAHVVDSGEKAHRNTKIEIRRQ